MLRKIKKTIGLNKLDYTFSHPPLLTEFKLSTVQNHKINNFLNILFEWNKKFNLVGKSTLTNPEKTHILDSIQIAKIIKNKKSKVIDIGTGAGLPGIVLSIYGYSNISLLDSNQKKINFIKYTASKLNLSINIINSRIENFKDGKFDFIIARALAKLDKLLFYASFLSHKKSQLIFLKGEKLNDEIKIAQKTWNFHFDICKSISDDRGKIIIIKSFNKI